MALGLTAGTAFGQVDNYDASSRTRTRYGTARDAVATNQDNTTPAGNSTDAPADSSKPATTWQPRRTYESPRSGSRNSTGTTGDRSTSDALSAAQTAGHGSDAASAGHSDTASPRSGDVRTEPRAAPRRATRGDVVRSSYSPSATSSTPSASTDGFETNSYAPAYGKARHQPGFMDNVTKEFSPRENYDTSYGYRSQRARLAMADQSGTPRPANSQPTESVMHGGEDLPHGSRMPMGNGDLGPTDGDWGDGDGPMQGGCGSCGGGSCGSCCCRPLCCLFCCDWWDQWGQDLSVFSGTQAFKGPVDQGFNGDFGFHEGVNWGSPLWDAIGLGAQIGVNVEQSDLSRTNATDLHRNQYFFTAGLFHRPECECGWQGGLVWDYLSDSFVDDYTASQLRGNLSYVFNCHELGFWFSAGVSDKELFSTTETEIVTTRYKPIDLYAFYYGHHFCNGGEGRIWGGFTGGTGGLVGADFSVPISDKLSIDSGFNYAIPKSVGSGSIPPESWNLSISLVLHPFSCSHQSYCSPYRPLFNVADNGSFMVDRQVTTTPNGG
jgi:hypothetical protein